MMRQHEDMIERVSDSLLSLDSTTPMANLINGFNSGLVTAEEVMEGLECQLRVAHFNQRVLARIASKLQAA